MNKFDSILKTSLEIPDFINSDVDDQWILFKSSVETSDDFPNDVYKREANLQIRYMLSFAAAMILVFSSLFLFKRPNVSSASLVTQNMADTVHLMDGSMVYVGPNSTLEYYTTLVHSNVRTVLLDGNASFDVSQSILPFKIFGDYINIEVLGTKFSIFHADDHIEVKNISGSVKVTNNLNPSMYKILEEGDILHYKNGQFSNPLDTVVIVTPEKPKTVVPKNISSPSPTPEIVQKTEAPKLSQRKFKLESVIHGHLLKLYKKKIKLQKKTKLNMESAVMLDIDQPYEDILKDLKKLGFIDYIQGDCPDCFIITAPQDKK
ncbi:MAG: FecR family protein [Saprospiraceae bacterium]